MSLRIFGGQFKGRILKSPNSETTRPTQGIVREAVFNICQGFIEESRFLDLFAGSGAMGLEALSRNAAHATFIEKNRLATECIKENLALLNLSNRAEVFSDDALTALRKIKKPFDIIYIDPPYDLPVFPVIDELLSQNLLTSWLFLEEREKTRIPISHPSLELYKERRYGIALLSIFRYISPS